jgi:hypothetical protein
MHYATGDGTLAFIRRGGHDTWVRYRPQLLAAIPVHVVATPPSPVISEVSDRTITVYEQGVTRAAPLAERNQAAGS